MACQWPAGQWIRCAGAVGVRSGFEGAGRFGVGSGLARRSRPDAHPPMTKKAPPELSPPTSSAPSRTTETPQPPVAAEAEAAWSGWMSAAQSGDADAYRKLLQAIQPKIRAIVFSRIKGEAAAEDVVQNALLSIHRGRATYRPERPFGPWMRAIVRNAVIDHFRDQKRRGDRETPLPVEEWAEDTSEPDPERAPLAPELADALARLPDKQREAVTLIQVEGLSVAEAALQANVSAGAMKVRAHRGYRALRSALEGLRTGGTWRSAEPLTGRRSGSVGDDNENGGSS